MDTKRRYWFVYLLTVGVVLLIVAGILCLFWSDLRPEERRLTEQLAPKLAVYALAGLVACLVLFSSLLRHLFRAYIDPIVALAHETRLIAVADTKYRIPASGGQEVVSLTGIINDLADKHLTLKTEVQRIVEYSRSEVQGEKQRLEALTAQMPEGVVVCNVDGRILLYNPSARSMIEGRDTGGLLGLGRSIFGVLDRRPLVYAVNYLENRIGAGHASAPFSFVTSRRGTQFLRIRVSPILASGEAGIEGYVLMLADVTERIRADSRRDIFLQSLTITLQEELGRIRDAAQQLGALPAAREGAAASYCATIVRSSARLVERLDTVAEQHATRLADGGTAEFILGHDLMDLLQRSVIDELGIECGAAVDAEIWLNMNAYTVVRGVAYLVGQLTKHTGTRRVELGLRVEAERGFLVVRWSGEPVRVQRVEEWRECPLMLGGTGRGTVSLASLLAGRGELRPAPDGDEEVLEVRFLLQMAAPETACVKDSTKTERPVYYEFDLFERKAQRTDFGSLSLAELTYVAFDTETTGLDPEGGDEIISIGAVRVVSGKLRREEVFDRLVDPKRSIPLQSLRIHEIYPEMLRGMPVITDVLKDFHRFAEGAVLVAHNAAFDMKLIHLKEQAAGVGFDHPVLDTLLLSAIAYPSNEPHNLETIAARLGLPVVGRHTALGDAIMAAEILLKLIPLLAERGIVTLDQALEASRHTPYSKLVQR